MITIWLEGGLVQEVTGLEPGQEIKVCDYDVDGTDDDRLQRVNTRKGFRKYAYVTYWIGKGKRRVKHG